MYSAIAIARISIAIFVIFMIAFSSQPEFRFGCRLPHAIHP